MPTFSLSDNGRSALSMLAVVLVAIAGAAADHANGALHLRALATLCVFAFTLFAGLRGAVAFALAVSAIYSIAGSTSPDVSGAADIALYTIVNVSAVFIANAMKSRVAEVARLKAELSGEMKARQHLADIALARTALREYEQRYLSVGEFIPFGTWHTRPDDTLHVSKSFLDLVGMTLEEVQAGGWTKRVVPEDADRYLEAWKLREQTAGIWENEYRIRGVDGKLYTILSRGTRLTGAHGESLGWVGVSFDITERKRAEERLEFLAEAGRQLALSLDPETTLGRIAGLCVPKLADWCTVDLLLDDGTLDLVAIKHMDPSRIEKARELREKYPPPVTDTGIFRVVRTGEPLLFEEVTDEMIAAAANDEYHLNLLRELELSSVMIVPLIARGKTLGAITFVSAESKRRFARDDIEFCEILGRRAALAYDNARLYARQQRVAEALQTASLPTSLPAIPGMRICATYRAGAKESEIGGDWYDAFELPDGELALSIGDVAGKGLKAAVAMSAVRQAFRAAAFEGASPADVLNCANRLLCHQNIGMVTAAVGFLNVETGVFKYSTAGHPPILSIAPGGVPRRLTTEGLPLGVLPGYSFTQSSTVIEPGTLLVMYTDGLLENTRDVVAGELAMIGAVVSEAASPSPNSAESIVARVLAADPTDDVAALTVHLPTEEFDRLDVTLPAEPESARIVRRGLRRLCVAAGLTEQTMSNVLVASGEAVSNAIQHAYGLEEGTVRVEAFRASSELIVEISDKGMWRAPRQDGHGRGMTLMHRLVDSVTVRKNDPGTTVVLRTAIGSVA